MMNNFFKNIVTSPNIDQLKTDLKKKENLIDKLREKLKKVQEEKEFVTRSYEQLEKKSADLEKKKGNEGSQFKQNMQFYLNALQKVPDEVMQSMVQILLSKLEEHIGQKIDSSASQSFLDLDFNYKNIFAEHATKIYQATKQRIEFETKKNQIVNIYQDKLASKDKEIEQLIDRYENNQKNIEKEFQNKIQGKVKELNMIKEEKNVMLMENSENLNRMIVQIQDLKKEIGRLKNSQSQLKVQKDRIEKKYSEACEMNNHLMNKNTQLEMDLKTVKAEKEIMMEQVMKQNSQVKESLKKQIAEAQQLKKQRVASDHDIQRMLDQLKLCQEENDKIKLESKDLSISNEVNKSDRVRLQRKIQNARQKISLISNLKEVLDGKSSIEANLLQFSKFFNNFTVQFSKKCQEIQKIEEKQDEKSQVSQVSINTVDSQLQKIKSAPLPIQAKEAQILEQQKQPQVSEQKQAEQLEQLRMKIENTQKLLEQSRSSHLKLQNQIVILRQQRQTSENIHNTSKSANIKLQEELTELKQKIFILESEKLLIIDQHEKRYLTIVQQIKSKQQQLLKANQQNNSKTQETNEKIKLFETSNNKLSQQVAQFSNALDISKRKISQYQVEISERNTQISIKSNKIKQLEKQIISLQESSHILQKQLEILKTQLQASNKQLQNERQLLKKAGSSESLLLQQISRQKQLQQQAEQKYKVLQQQVRDKQIQCEGNSVRLTDEIKINKQLSEKISILQDIKKDLECTITNLTQQAMEKNALSTKKYSQELFNISQQLSQKTSILAQAEGEIANLTITLQENKKKLEQYEKFIKQLEQTSSQQKQSLIKQGKNKQKQLQRQLQEKEKEKNQLIYQLQRSQQREKIITEEMSSKQGHQNDSLHLIKELQHKYQSQIDSKHQQIIILQQKVSQYEAKIQKAENQLSNSIKQICKMKNEIEVQRGQSQAIKVQLKESLVNTQQKLKQEIEKVIDQVNTTNNLKDSLVKIEENLQEANRQLNTLRSQKILLEQNTKKQNKIHMDQIENLKLNIDQKNNQLTAVNQQLQSLRTKRIQTLQQIKEHLDHISNLKQELEVTKQLITNLQQKQTQLKDLATVLQRQNTDTLNTCSGLKSQLQQTNIKLKTVQQSMGKLTIKDEELEENIVILNAQIERYQEKQQKVAIQIESLKTIYEEKLSQNQKLNASIELIIAENNQKEETLKTINQRYQTVLLQSNLLEKQKSDIEEQYKIKLEEIKLLNEQLGGLKADNDHFRQQVSDINKALKGKQEEYTIFINKINEEYSNTQKSYEQLKALSKLENSQNNQRISKLLGQKQQVANSLTIMENNIRELSARMQQYEKQNAEKQALIDQKVETIDSMQAHNSHLLEKISQQQRQIEDNRKQIELSQLTNNEILSTIAALRSELQRQVAYYQFSYQESQIQNKKTVEQKQAIIDSINKQLSQSKLAAENKAEVLRAQINQLLQADKNREQKILSLQAQIQIKNEQIRQHLIMISDLQKKLAQQIQQKSQALQDKQFMSELYKDFEARQTQIGTQQKKLKQFQQDSLYFLNILHKEFSKQSINSIKNNHDLMNIEIKRQQDQTKAAEEQLNQKILKLNQEIIEQTNIAAHFEGKVNELNALKQTLGKDLQEQDKELLKLKKEFKDKQLQILNEKNKLEQLNQKLKIQVQQFKAKITKKETEVSKFSENIIELEQKFNNTKRLLDDKEKQVAQKENQLVQLKKQVQIFKNKMFEENKQKVEEKDYYEKQLHKLRTEIQRMIIQNVQNAKKQQIAREDAVKSQKSILDKLHKEEIRKIKEAIESYKKQKEDAEKQMVNAKNQLLQERKISAKITAKLNEVTTELAKLESLQLSSQEIQQKMLLKDEEIKKCFANIQSLKSTIMDLQEGIQTYQSMAEQKEREVEEQRERFVSLEIEMQKMKNDLQRNQRKLKDARMQKKVEQVINDKKDIIQKKQSSILPLKLLFLKYFEIGANYEAKLRAFNTLCQALSLNSKELQQMNQYKKTKLILQVPSSERQKNQSLQNKFFNFLNSD